MLQLHYLRRWVAKRCPHPGRRKDDLPLPEVTRHLSQDQLDRYCRWVALLTPPAPKAPKGRRR